MRTVINYLPTFFLLLPWSVAWGQEPRALWKPRPLPEARTFLVTETGLGYRINDDAEDHRYYTSELGVMVNTSESFAVGATSFAGVNEAGFRWGVKARFRWWLDRDRSIEVSPGLILCDTRGRTKTPELMGSAALNVTNWIALVGQVEVVRTYPTDHAVYLGVRVGSTPGLAGNFTAAAVALFFFIAVLTAPAD